MTFEELAKVNRILYNLTVPAGTILHRSCKKRINEKEKQLKNSKKITEMRLTKVLDISL